MTSERLSIQRSTAIALRGVTLAIVLTGLVVLTGTTVGTLLINATAAIGGGAVVSRKLVGESNEGESISMTGLSRNVLVSVLLISISIEVGTVLIAFNDENWGDTGTILYNVLGLVGLLGILWSTVLLVVKAISHASE